VPRFGESAAVDFRLPIQDQRLWKDSLTGQWAVLNDEREPFATPKSLIEVGFPL
jgi:hypothetical protein